MNFNAISINQNLSINNLLVSFFFIDHDLTREKRTVLTTPGIVNVNNLTNERTSWFDLDSCFGENNEFLNLHIF